MIYKLELSYGRNATQFIVDRILRDLPLKQVNRLLQDDQALIEKSNKYLILFYEKNPEELRGEIFGITLRPEWLRNRIIGDYL